MQKRFCQKAQQEQQRWQEASISLAKGLFIGNSALNYRCKAIKKIKLKKKKETSGPIPDCSTAIHCSFMHPSCFLPPLCLFSTLSSLSISALHLCWHHQSSNKFPCLSSFQSWVLLNPHCSLPQQFFCFGLRVFRFLFWGEVLGGRRTTHRLVCFKKKPFLAICSPHPNHLAQEAPYHLPI